MLVRDDCVLVLRCFDLGFFLGYYLARCASRGCHSGGLRLLGCSFNVAFGYFGSSGCKNLWLKKNVKPDVGRMLCMSVSRPPLFGLELCRFG